MSFLSDRIFKLASDAARLAAMLSARHDIVGALIERLVIADVQVTHAAHETFAASGISVYGPEPFEAEGLVVRRIGQEIAFEADERLPWIAFSLSIPPGNDVIVEVDGTTAHDSAVTAYIRARAVDGTWADGDKVALGAGAISTDGYVRHPDFAAEGLSSEFLVTIDLFSQVTWRTLAIASAAPEG